MFDIASAADFYAVLVQDFDDFMDEPHSARRALHCAITAYHLHEWVWGDLVKHNKAMRKDFDLKDSKAFLKWICDRSVWFSQVQALVNGTKHFGRDQGFETTRIVAAPFAWGQLHAGWGEGAWNGPIRYMQSEHAIGPKGQGYLLIDNGEGAGEHRFMMMASLLEVVLRFWRDFFRTYYPSIKVPVSPHHSI